MSLSTLKPEDSDVGRVHTARARPPPEEVEHSKPLLPWKRYLVGQPATEPLPYCTPRTHYPPVDTARRRIDFNLDIRDIEYTKPQRDNMASSRRRTTPVDPVYQLPTSKPAEEMPPRKFLRPTNFIRDIEGCTVKPSVAYGPRELNSLKTDDIDKAKSTILHPAFNKKSPPASPSGKLRPRNTNPLDPEYQVSIRPPGSILAQWSEYTGEKPKFDAVTIGFVKGSTPRRQRTNWNAPFYPLENRDIPRAKPESWIGCVPSGRVTTRDIISVGDIQGCQADTRLRKPRNSRELEKRIEWESKTAPAIIKIEPDSKRTPRPF